MPYSFEWDPKKAAANLHKHGVSFAEATEALVIHCHSICRNPVIPAPKSDFWCSASPKVVASW
jgi:hypothetical protein